MSRRRAAAGLCGVLAAGHAGCGYQVMGGARLFEAPSICVRPFAEQEPNGLSAPLAAGLRQRLLAGSPGAPNLAQPNAATLGGTVHLTSAPSTTLRGVQTYAVRAEVHAVLSQASGRMLWQRDFCVREEFLPTDAAQDIQPLVSEARRRTALVRLAERAAHAVHEAMVLDFFAQTHTEPS